MCIGATLHAVRFHYLKSAERVLRYRSARPPSVGKAVSEDLKPGAVSLAPFGKRQHLALREVDCRLMHSQN